MIIGFGVDGLVRTENQVITIQLATLFGHEIVGARLEDMFETSVQRLLYVCILFVPPVMFFAEKVGISMTLAGKCSTRLGIDLINQLELPNKQGYQSPFQVAGSLIVFD